MRARVESPQNREKKCFFGSFLKKSKINSLICLVFFEIVVLSVKIENFENNVFLSFASALCV